MSPTYLALRKYGFSAAKAHEVLLDHERGDKYASAFVDLAIQNYPPNTPSDELVIERTKSP